MKFEWLKDVWSRLLAKTKAAFFDDPKDTWLETVREHFGELVVDDTFLELWGTYWRQLLDVVARIDTGEIGVDREESKFVIFKEAVREILDIDKDGKLTFNDIPESVIELVHAFAVRVLKNSGKASSDRATATFDLAWSGTRR